MSHTSTQEAFLSGGEAWNCCGILSQSNNCAVVIYSAFTRHRHSATCVNTNTLGAAVLPQAAVFLGTKLRLPCRGPPKQALHAP